MKSDSCDSLAKTVHVISVFNNEKAKAFKVRELPHGG
jgi:hypothetical protein